MMPPNPISPVKNIVMQQKINRANDIGMVNIVIKRARPAKNINKYAGICNSFITMLKRNNSRPSRFFTILVMNVTIEQINAIKWRKNNVAKRKIPTSTPDSII